MHYLEFIYTTSQQIICLDRVDYRMADDDQFSTPIPQTAHKHRHLHLGTESRGTDLLTKTPAAGIVTKVGGTAFQI